MTSYGVLSIADRERHIRVSVLLLAVRKQGDVDVGKRPEFLYMVYVRFYAKHPLIRYTFYRLGVYSVLDVGCILESIRPK